MLRKPAVEGVDRLACVGADDAVRVGVAPRIRMTHHHVEVVHTHVEEVPSSPLQLGPECALHIQGIQLLELLPHLLVLAVEIAEEASVATHLERLVDDVVEARPEELCPFGTVAGRAVQRDLHVSRLDVPRNAVGRRPDAEVCGVWRRLLEGQAHLSAHKVRDVHGVAEGVALVVVRQMRPDEVPLRTRHRVRRRCGGPGVRQLATFKLRKVRILDLLQLPLQLLPRSLDVVPRRRRLLRGRVRDHGHLSKEPRPGHVVGGVDRRLRLQRRVLREA
mmetsp:Transcript_104074/g.301082  ORF Transcript_104074/g.301082 Transcript_104074/m.301082 type:complete len:276 (+) Transcript_104074:202-1029(+)